MREIDTIIVHCSAEPMGRPTDADTIRRWHKTRGWSDIGYHWVIKADGVVEQGRPEATPGAHVRGHNATSIGVCLVGGLDDNMKPNSEYSPGQWHALENLVESIQMEYDVLDSNIIGHNQLAAKACPCFDVPAWWARVKASEGMPVKAVPHWVLGNNELNPAGPDVYYWTQASDRHAPILQSSLGISPGARYWSEPVIVTLSPGHMEPPKLQLRQKT